MKKEYIKPEMTVENILLESMIATSVSISDETTDADATMGNDRRGGWGSLWN